MNGAHRCPTTPLTSRSLRASTQYASAPACTSARPVSAGCTTWSTRWSTTPSTRRWPARPTRSRSRCREDGSVTVVDNGRGIPVDLHPVEKRPAVEVVLTVLHAGGKFGGGGYSVSGGLHGVGVSVVNALSSRLEVEVHRDGFVWRQSYERGVPTAPLAKGEATDSTGTTITFWADDEIFDSTVYSFDTLARRSARDGLPEPRSHHRAHRRTRRPTDAVDRPGVDEVAGPDDSPRRLLLRRWNRRLRPAHQRAQQDRPGPRQRDRVRRRGRRSRHEPRGRDAVERRLHRGPAHVCEHDQHPRGWRSRRGIPYRA